MFRDTQIEMEEIQHYVDHFQAKAWSSCICLCLLEFFFQIDKSYVFAVDLNNLKFRIWVSLGFGMAWDLSWICIVGS